MLKIIFFRIFFKKKEIPSFGIRLLVVENILKLS